MTGVTLTSAQRNNLLSLQETQDLSEQTQLRLATGRRVNNVSDDAVAFFRSAALIDRADDFAIRRDNINQANTHLLATLEGVEGIDSLLKQLRGITEATRSQTTAERQNSNDVFTTVLSQIFQLVEDTSYQGLNLLNRTSNQLVTFFGVRTASRLAVDGFNLNATVAQAERTLFTTIAFSQDGAGILSGIFNATRATGLAGTPLSFTDIGANNSTVSAVDSAITLIDSAIARLRGFAAVLGSNSSILETRLEFTRGYTNNLRSGADSLVLADLNEEGANTVVLNTRQQLGIQSLRVAGQQQAAIINLIN